MRNQVTPKNMPQPKYVFEPWRVTKIGHAFETQVGGVYSPPTWQRALHSGYLDFNSPVSSDIYYTQREFHAIRAALA
jgi:hypothetical protein